MKNANATIPRRAFLSGAASLLGATALGGVAGARGQAAGPIASGLAAYFWNGRNFVPVSEATEQPTAQPTVQVRMYELTGSSPAVAIDALLPGGTFHAYVGSPQGSGQASFTAPYSRSGVSISTSQGQSSQSFSLAANGAMGFYLLVGPHQKVGSLLLLEGAHPTVIDSSGAPLGNPTILLQFM